MKILIVRMYADCLNIKNYNCQEIGLAKALIRKGNKCDIVLYIDQKAYEEDIIFDEDNKKIHIYYLNAREFFKNAIFEPKLYDIAKEYDVIQTAEYDQIGNVKLKRKLKNKMVIYHGPYASKYTKGYNKKCLISDFYYLFNPKYKKTPCLSKSNLATELLKKKQFKDITTVGVGLDVDRFKNNKEPNEIIKELMVKKEEEKLKYLLYIGKIEDRRNIIFLIDILAKVTINDSNVRLILVGKGEQDYIDKCFKYAEQKNVLDKIIYHQAIQQQELPNLYKACDIFLLPTQYEIFGMVLLEAMYFGVPAITTLNGGSSTLIENERDGIVCSLDIDNWYTAIKKLLQDEEFKNQISKNSMKKIKDEYTWDCLSEKFIKVYRKVIK